MDVCKTKSSDRTTWGNCTKLDLYCKNVYNPMVKVSDWERHGDSLPIDVDPYCPTAFDLHYSHYLKIGGDNSPAHYTTTTQDMLSQIFTRRLDFEINPNKSIINLYSNIDNAEDEGKQAICPSPFGPDFRTTMQHSYQPPYPYLMKGITMAEPPYFLHRVLKQNGSCKFLDDDHILHTQRLQTHKSGKYISYNPCTGFYTDGTLGDTRDIY